MVTIIPLLEASMSVTALSTELVAHMRNSGMPLPEDECFLDYIAAAVRHGRTRAVLAVRDEQAIGVAAWYSDSYAGHIALLHTLTGESPDVTRALLSQAMDELRGADESPEIYAELPALPPPVVALLKGYGFVAARRDIMCARTVDTPPLVVPPGYRLTAWQQECLEDAAAVIYQANVGTLDAQIIPELRSLTTTRRIVWQTLDGRYGRFDREASGLALAADATVVGVALVTRRASRQGFTAEICVLPGHQGRGLGRALMRRMHAVLAASGLTESMLGVTEGNPARYLYESLGYGVIGSVWTYVWPRPEGWLGPE